MKKISKNPLNTLNTLSTKNPGDFGQKPVSSVISNSDSIEFFKNFEKFPGEAEVLISFIDLTGYTQFSKTISDSQLFSLFQSLFYEVGKKIEKGGGLLIKVIGDAALILFPKSRASFAIPFLYDLKGDLEKELAKKGWKTKAMVKVHFGTVVLGRVGARGRDLLDCYGKAVNQTAILPTSGFSITPQAFRMLSPEGRKKFKKHSPPYYYIPSEDKHFEV